jgi:APA family basic amino acid/polyamine antiporter
MAAQLGSPVWLTLIWIIAGIFSLFGALIYAELGAMIPETGGLYIYFRKMFGEFTGFLYGWAAFAVINTTAVAAISFVCARYSDYFLHLPRLDAVTEHSVVWHIPFIGDLFPLEDLGVKSLAILLVLIFTVINYLSTKAGSIFQVISTFIKVAALVLLVCGIFFSGNGNFHNFIAAEHPKQNGALLSGIMAALTGAFFAYDGWTNITCMAGEVHHPQKNIPRSLFVGVAACITIYVLVNQAYLYVLPVEQIGKSPLVAADAMTVALGSTGGAIIAALIVICTLGAVNGNTMATTRITYAMGKDKVFLPWAGKEHKRFQTPGNALWLHAIWTSVFIITGSFDMLADIMVFITWVTYGLGAIGIFILRKKMAEAERPYKIWRHPLVTISFIAFSTFFLGATIYNDVANYRSGAQPVVNSVLGLLITALGIPLYFYYRKKKK